MKLTSLISATTLLLLPYFSFAQILGGTLPGDPTPREAEVADLTGNASKGDVDLFTGAYGHQVNLGSVSTPGGLSFSLNLNYNSSVIAGKNMPLTNGLIYGYGWSLDIPKVTMEYFEYKDESDQVRQNFISSKIIAGYPDEIIGESHKHGDVYFEAPYVNIPGVFSGRMVLKQINKRNEEYIFVPHEFSDYGELTISSRGEKWEFKTSEGVVYEFGLAKRQYREALNTRDMHYDASKVPNAIDGNGNPSSDPLVQKKLKQSHIPKGQTVEWYCTRIWNQRTPKFQGITFDYDRFGKFNHFKEFSEDYDQNLARMTAIKLFGDSIKIWIRDAEGTILEDANGDLRYKMIPGYVFNMINLVSYEDIILKEVVAYDFVAPVQRIELGYRTQKNFTLLNGLTVGTSGVEVLDSLNLYTSHMYYGSNPHSSSHVFDPNQDPNFYVGNSFKPVSIGQPNNFNGWRRYLHGKHDKLQNLSINSGQAINSTNPYIGTGLNAFLYYETLGNLSSVDFDHGYLESPDLTGMIPGEKYEIRTYVSLDPNQSSQNLFLFDINIETSSNTPGLDVGTSSLKKAVSGGYYNLSQDIFNTFRKGFKWSVSMRDRFRVTSNFFNAPQNLTTNTEFRIQVGPANSDHQFNHEKFGMNNDYTFPTNDLSTRASERYIAQLREKHNTVPALHQNAAIPANFGIGLPWHQLRGVYEPLALDSDLIYNFWWHRNNITNPNLDNTPTASESANLHAVELIRYAKNPYMLDYVSVEVLNGETVGSKGSGWARTKYLEFEYDNHVASVIPHSFQHDTTAGNSFGKCVNPYSFHKPNGISVHDSTGNQAVDADPSSRNFIVLTGVKQLPVSRTDFYTLSSATPITTAQFGYSEKAAWRANLTHAEKIRLGLLDTWSSAVVLTNITDQLGKETEIVYHEMVDHETHFVEISIGEDKPFSRTLQLTLPVEKIYTQAEQGRTDSIVYDYKLESFRASYDAARPAIGPSGHFKYNGFSSRGKAGYGEVSTYSTTLNNQQIKETFRFFTPANPFGYGLLDCSGGGQSAIGYRHYPQLDTSGVMGKLKEKLTYNGQNQLTQKETYTYTRRKAYEAANKRPLPYYDSYYQTDYVDYNEPDLSDYTNAFSGNLNALELEIGKYVKVEAPTALYGGTTGLRDSYFVTLDEKTTTTYDNALCDNPAGFVTEVGFDNPIGAPPGGRQMVIIGDLNNGNYNNKEAIFIADVRPEFPLADTLLGLMIDPEVGGFSNELVKDVLVAQPDLSDAILFHLMESREGFRNEDLTTVLLSIPYRLSDSVLAYIDLNRSEYYNSSDIETLTNALPVRPAGAVTSLDQRYVNTVAERESIMIKLEDDVNSAENLGVLVAENTPMADAELLYIVQNHSIPGNVLDYLLAQPDVSDTVLNTFIAQETVKEEQIEKIVSSVPHVVSADVIEQLVIEEKKISKDIFRNIILDHPFLSIDSYTHLRTSLHSANSGTAQYIFEGLSNVPDAVLRPLLGTSTKFFYKSRQRKDFILNQTATISDTTMQLVAQYVELLDNADAIAVFTNPALYYDAQAMANINASTTLSNQAKGQIDDFFKGQATNGCGIAVTNLRPGITIKENYRYYWANPNGTTSAEGYKLLLDNNSASFNLHYEPSWKLFSTTITSPQQPGWEQVQENYYFYDLYNRYRADFIQPDLDMTVSAFMSPPIPVGNDTLTHFHVTYNVYDNTSLTGYQGYTGYPNPENIIGAKLSRKHGVRGLAYQKNQWMTNGRGEAPTLREQYFDYHSYWPTPDLPQRTTINFTAQCDTASNPHNDPLVASGCIRYESGSYLNIPDGYIQWQLVIDTLPEDRHYVCPCGLIDTAVISDDFFPVASNPTQILHNFRSTNTCNGAVPTITTLPSLGLPLIENFIFRDILMPAEELVKLDTILTNDYEDLDATTSRNLAGRARRLMEFKERDPNDAVNSKNSNYVLPYPALSQWKILEINSEGLPQYVRDEKFVHTRFHYDTAYFLWYRDQNCHPNSYSASLHTNVGVPTKITQGGRVKYRYLGPTVPLVLRAQGHADSVNTFYTYNKDYSIQQMEGPNNQQSRYEYDEFGRLSALFKNGVMIQSSDYSLWNGDTSLTFEQRAEQNRVRTNTRFEDFSAVGTSSYTWIDPKGRTYSAANALTNIVNTTDNAIAIDYTGRTVYDVWGRTTKQYQSFTYQDGNNLSAIIPRFSAIDTNTWANTFTHMAYELDKRSRPIQAADFGQTLYTSPNKRMRYAYLNSSCLSCELSLNNYEAWEILGSDFTTHPAQVFRMEEAEDEDGNMVRNYYNAANQQVASLNVNGTNSPVTLFTYDNAGNLAKVIHPSKNETRNHYNLVGLLWKKDTPDEGTWRYVYNRSGQIRYEVNRGSLKKLATGDQSLSYYQLREYRYDHFGRLVQQKLHLRNLHDEVPNKFFSDTPVEYDFSTVNGQDLQNGVITRFHASHALAYDFLSSYEVVSGLVPPGSSYTPIQEQLPLTLQLTPLTYSEIDIVNGELDDNLAMTTAERINQSQSPIPAGEAISYVMEKEFKYSAPYLTNLTANAAAKVTNSQRNIKGQLSTSLAYMYPLDIHNYDMFKARPFWNDNIAEIKAYSYNNDGELEWEVGQVNLNGITSSQRGMAYLIDYPKYNTLGQAVVQDIDIHIDDTLDVRYINDYDPRGNLSRVYAQFEDDFNQRHLINKNEFNTAYGTLETQRYYRPCSGSANALASEVDAIDYRYTDRLAVDEIDSRYYTERLTYDADTLMANGQTVQQGYNYNGNINNTRHSYRLQSMTNYIAGQFEEPTLYGYQYDSLNRLVVADAYLDEQAQLNGANGHQVGDAVYQYNTMSALTDLERLRPVDPQTNQVTQDEWKYVYAANSHRLAEVDGVGSSVDGDFTYDHLGNITRDTYRKINNSVYGHSNLPYVVDTDTHYNRYWYGSNNERIFKLVKKRNIIAGVEPISVAEFYLHDHMGRTMGALDMRTGTWNWYVYADKRIAKLVPDAVQQPQFYPDQWSNDSTIAGGGDNIQEMHHDFTHFLVKSGKVITTPTDITAIEVDGVHRLFDPDDWNDTLAIDPDLDDYVVGRFTVTDEDVLFSYSNPATGFDQLLPIGAIDLTPRTHVPGAGGERPPVDPNPDVPSGYWKEHGQALADSVVFYVHDHLSNLRVAYGHELAGCNPNYDTAITIHSIDTTLTFLSSSIDTIVQLTDPNTGEKYFDTLWVDLYDTAYFTNYDTLVTAVMDTQHTVLHQALDYYPYGKVLRMLQYDPQRHRLQGNQHDNETGLEYFNARMLETDLGFFRSVDPLSLHPNQVDKSPYQAMWGNPILLSDPTGECPSCIVKDFTNWLMSDIPAQQRIDDIASFLPGNYTFRAMVSKQDPINLNSYSGQELAHMSIDMASLAMTAYAGTTGHGNVKAAGTSTETSARSVQQTAKKLSNAEVRAWYSEQVKSINSKLKPTEANARSVVEQRNSLKRQARDMMSDRDAAAQLDKDYPIQDYDYYQNKYSNEGYSGESLYERIIGGGKTPNPDVNQKFGLDP